MQLPEGKKIYFASDFHLGIPDRETSIAREKRLCQWLDSIKDDAHELYLVGDLFDAWFEYKNVVPKGYTRFLGKLAELSDAGVHIEAFTGNHDLWMRGYFQDELNIEVHHQPIERTFNGKRFFIGHGDGLGPGDNGYKMLKKVLRHPLSQWLYRRVHPDTGVGMASWLSRLGPKHVNEEAEKFQGPEKEWLVQFCNETLERKHFDYFIFGHRHITLEYQLPKNSLYVNLGDWLKYDSYAVFDGKDLKLAFYKEKKEYMQRTLVMIRHAQAGWPTIEEFELARKTNNDIGRPLTEEGKTDAKEMGRKLAELGIIPDVIIASAANRTMQTAQEIAHGVKYDPGCIKSVKDLYQPEEKDFEHVINELDDKLKTVFIVSHDPAISRFVGRINNIPGIIYDGMPTCGVAAIHVEANHWKEFSIASKNIFLFEYPKKES